ncbi:FAD-dependent oxidoreductase [Streptacidiphilus sp. N1-3]|uniref:FAD-dependent oxidoreductase n=1 Tax=Streptacidiphilus alkalitolerans TaxID=3342712 RepID=A0ABV6XBV0_9ACTN
MCPASGGNLAEAPDPRCPSSRIVVIGGGYAGTLAANRLQSSPAVDVTLLNARPSFVDRVRLHQFVAGSGSAEVDFTTLLGARVRPLVDSAERIDAAARTVELASGRSLDYDDLVYAVGSTAAAPASVPGAAEFAFPVAEYESAKRLRGRLDKMSRGVSTSSTRTSRSTGRRYGGHENGVPAHRRTVVPPTRGCGVVAAFRARQRVNSGGPGRQRRNGRWRPTCGATAGWQHLCRARCPGRCCRRCRGPPHRGTCRSRR